MITAEELIVAAAAATADGPDWTTRVSRKATALAFLINPKSPLMKGVSGMITGDVKVFEGVVVRVEHNSKMNRDFITLDTGTTRPNLRGMNNAPLPPGQESVRTDFLSDGGDVVSAAAKSLVGQRARVYVYMEPIESGDQKGQEVRICKDIQPAAAHAVQSPVQMPQSQPQVSGRVVSIVRDPATARGLVTVDTGAGQVVVATAPASDEQTVGMCRTIRGLAGAGESATFAATGAYAPVNGQQVTEVVLVA